MRAVEDPVGASAAAPPAPGEPLLVCEDVRTYFHSERGVVRAVDGVSLTLSPGRTLGIVGESGSGKSVLARSIMNILPRRTTIKAGGKIWFKGRDIRPLPRREMRKLWGLEMAIVFQDPMTSLNPVLRVGDQVIESLQVRMGMTRAQASARALELFRSVGIPAPERRMREYPHQLSGGMRQRVTIAIALACNPELLLADEPTTALDVTVQRQILDLLSERQRVHRMATILITHDFGVVAGRVDETVVMYAGRAVERAPTSLLFTEARHPYTDALIRSIPRLENPPHTRLEAISGRPPDLVNPGAGCPFAPRCRYAQQRCLTEVPPMRHTDGTGHEYACFHPVGTDEGASALRRNLDAGRTAAGLPVTAPATGGHG